MRATDQAPPVVPFDGHPRPWWMHGRVVVALERLPQAAYVWDDDDPTILWDDADPDRLVWDAPFIGSGFSDVWCDLVTLELDAGMPDQFDQYQTGSARLTLRDPGDGRYRARTADGRLIWFAPGRRLAVYWLDPGDEPWWLFSGAVATWRTQLDGTVNVEAFSGTGQLSRSVGRPWTAGATTDLPVARFPKVLAAVGYTGPTRLDAGDVTLAVPAAADVLAFDVLKQVAASDGGLVYSDADDTLLYRDRRWRRGRPDQTSIPTLTDNVCDTPAVVGWDPQTADIDLLLAGTVTLTNTAEPPLTATATGTTDYVDPDIVFTHLQPDLWQTQADGNQLAAHEAQARSDARMALGSFVVHLHDFRFDYWADMLDRRLGDLVRWLHEDRWSTTPPTIDLYDVQLVVTTLQHSISPDLWTVTLGTSPAVAYTAVELWDVTSLTWDDPSPLAVWR